MVKMMDSFITYWLKYLHQACGICCLFFSFSFFFFKMGHIKATLYDFTSSVSTSTSRCPCKKLKSKIAYSDFVVVSCPQLCVLQLLL